MTFQESEGKEETKFVFTKSKVPSEEALSTTRISYSGGFSWLTKEERQLDILPAPLCVQTTMDIEKLKNLIY